MTSTTVTPARDLAGLMLVEGTLVATSPLHVGGLGAGPDVDLALARDGLGRLIVPGTSLAGSMCEWLALEATSSEELKLALWGFVRDRPGAGEDGQAARLYVEDLPVRGAAPSVSRRDGVGIDRRTGAAAARLKYDREVLDAGTELGFELTLELSRDEHRRSLQTTALATLLDGLRDGRIGLGADRSGGLGRVELRDGRVRELGLTTPGGLLAALDPDGSATTIDQFLEENEPAEVKRRNMRLAIALKQGSGPAMSAGEAGVATDTLPLVTVRGNGKVAFTIQGRGIKGVLRADAERIVRTVLGRRAPEGAPAPDADPEPWLELVEILFGARPAGGQDDPDADWLPGRSAVWCEDCVSEPFEAKHWDEVRRAEKLEALSGMLARVPAMKGARASMHAAIDRWTGGAAKGALFSRLEPPPGGFREIGILLDLGRLPPDEPRRGAALALLWLVLAELRAGRIAIGYSTNRGLGWLEPGASIAVDGSDEGELAWLGSEAPPQEFKERWRECKERWGEWIAGAREQWPSENGDAREGAPADG